jgi:nucleotide-binding universal stress UspA family protein
MMIKRILVPIDFSPNSFRALDYAIEVGKPFKARLSVLYVVEPIYYAVPDFTGSPAMGELLTEQMGTARAQLARLERQYAKRRVKLQALLETGTAYEAIVETAKQIKADLIAMATHGRTGMSHLLLGSVAERVVRTAPCPVLTLRPGQRLPRAASHSRTRAKPRTPSRATATRR